MAAGFQAVRGQPGVFVLPGGRPIKLVEWREDAIKDTVNVQVGTTSTAFGSELEYFDNIASKRKRDCNIGRTHQIPAGWELIATKLGIYVHLATGNTECLPSDAKKIYENSSLEVKINDTLIADGWAALYQTGVGLSGNTQENQQGFVSPGVPSLGAAPTLLVPQEINDGHEIRAKLRFDAYAWATTVFTAASMSVGCTTGFMFRGFLKRALSKG